MRGRLLSAACATALLVPVGASPAAPVAGPPQILLPSFPAFPTQCTTASLEVRPRRIQVACGDGNLYFTSLKWHHYSGRRAYGAGNAHSNDCTPDCARGHFHRYRVVVSLTRVKICSPGVRQFTRLAYRYVGRKPTGAERKSSQKYDCETLG